MMRLLVVMRPGEGVITRTPLPTTFFINSGNRREEDVICFCRCILPGPLRIVDHFACCENPMRNYEWERRRRKLLPRILSISPQALGIPHEKATRTHFTSPRSNGE